MLWEMGERGWGWGGSWSLRGLNSLGPATYHYTFFPKHLTCRGFAGRKIHCKKVPLSQTVGMHVCASLKDKRTISIQTFRIKFKNASKLKQRLPNNL